MPGQIGNKGGGRKSAYQERQDAEWLASVWTGDIDRAELARKIATKVHSVRDVYLFKALMGNDRILESIADKILPDKVDLKAFFEDMSPDDVDAKVLELIALEERANKNAQKS